MNQEWFDMTNIRQRRHANAVWISLRSSQILLRKGEYGFLGYEEEFFGAEALSGTTPVKVRAKFEDLSALGGVGSGKPTIEIESSNSISDVG